jgi:hypothetical protein
MNIGEALGIELRGDKIFQTLYGIGRDNGFHIRLFKEFFQVFIGDIHQFHIDGIAYTYFVGEIHVIV